MAKHDTDPVLAHLRGGRAGTGHEAGLWRISLEAVDGWELRSAAQAGSHDDDKGPFARLLGA
jgi:hypothetical protein